MSSRLRHAEENEDGYRGIPLQILYPTLPGFGGVTKEFEKGDQKYYACRCSRCNHDNIPGWYTHFTVPGYDGDMREFDAQTATPLDCRQTFGSLHPLLEVRKELVGRP